MEINLKLQDAAYHLKASNDEGRFVEIDGSPDIGGNNKGMRPMQLMLSAIGSCSSMDILSILRKQKQEIKDYHVKVTANREKGKIPSLFESIHIHYEFTGSLDAAKVERAISLSLTKYCSVSRIMEKSANISHSYNIKPI